MGATVHDAKRTKASLQEALASAADFLVRQPEHQALAVEARSMAGRLDATPVTGREVDPADTATMAFLQQAAALGRSVLTRTEAGRKVPRLSARVEEAERILAIG